MAMTNMKTSAEEAKEMTQPSPADAPRYPYGLELHLDDDTLAKLGFTTPPPVGTVLMVTARVEVTSASQYQTQGSEAEMSSCWQVTDMEAAGTSKNTDAASLYPNSKMS